MYRLTDWPTNRPTDWPTDQPTDWLTNWPPTDWLSGRPTDWQWKMQQIRDSCQPTHKKILIFNFFYFFLLIDQPTDQPNFFGFFEFFKFFSFELCYILLLDLALRKVDFSLWQIKFFQFFSNFSIDIESNQDTVGKFRYWAITSKNKILGTS